MDEWTNNHKKNSFHKNPLAHELNKKGFRSTVNQICKLLFFFAESIEK